MKAEDWINVVDQMPSNSRMVLVYTDKGKLHLAQLAYKRIQQARWCDTLDADC